MTFTPLTPAIPRSPPTCYLIFNPWNPAIPPFPPPPWFLCPLYLPLSQPMTPYPPDSYVLFSSPRHSLFHPLPLIPMSSSPLSQRFLIPFFFHTWLLTGNNFYFYSTYREGFELTTSRSEATPLTQYTTLYAAENIIFFIATITSSSQAYVGQMPKMNYFLK